TAKRHTRATGAGKPLTPALKYRASGAAFALAASRSCTGRGVHAPVLGNAEPFLAHPLVELAIMGVFSRAGSCRIVFGFGDGLLYFWGFTKAGGRDKRHVPPRQSATLPTVGQIGDMFLVWRAN